MSTDMALRVDFNPVCFLTESEKTELTKLLIEADVAYMEDHQEGIPGYSIIVAWDAIQTLAKHLGIELVFNETTDISKS